MTHEVVAIYMLTVGCITNLILLTLQVGTYLKTRHPSLATMTVSTALGVVGPLINYTAGHIATSKDPMNLYFLAAGLLTTQSMVSIISVTWLFSAFRRAAPRRTMGS